MVLVVPAVVITALLEGSELGTVLLVAPGPVPVFPAAASSGSSAAVGPKSCEATRGDLSSTVGERADCADVEGAIDASPLLSGMEGDNAAGAPNFSICSLQRSSGIRASESSARMLLTCQSSAITGASLVIPMASHISIIRSYIKQLLDLKRN